MHGDKISPGPIIQQIHTDINDISASLKLSHGSYACVICIDMYVHFLSRRGRSVSRIKCGPVESQVLTIFTVSVTKLKPSINIPYYRDMWTT